ncbi:phosphatase PAP2 family protein [Methylobacterium sp. J-068]|uniref:phosphatase PAP2 family protein n=1 Tax=Methylobacterium sp. J-068 TaxID=2836649 RepID=UPI001FBA37FF|nr:phosphatase PAP2 family protein [Methylobacterium sp. J-068]MCJ2035387.1 phosphatase PAP2 family protein [Methylobacterium sp. J-068]
MQQTARSSMPHAPALTHALAHRKARAGLQGFAGRFTRPLDARRLTPFTWALFGILLAATTVAVRHFGFTLLVPPQLVACAAAAGVILFLLRDSALAGRMPALTLGCLVYVLFGVQSLAAVTLSYALLATDLPLTDAVLLGIDRALGFDWLAFRRAVLALPTLDGLLGQAYASLGVQFALVPALLLASGRARRTEAFLAAVIACEFVACFVSAVWPCMGGVSLDGFASVADATPGATHLAHYLPLRDGSLRLVDSGSLYGLISFPSFHCAAAYLAVAALWPLRWTRAPMLLLDGAMTLSAVTHGAHYLADCAGGLGLAALAFPLCHRAVDRSADRAGRRPAARAVEAGEALA